MTEYKQHTASDEISSKREAVTHQLCADCRSYFSRWRVCPRRAEDREGSHAAENYYWWPGAPTREELVATLEDEQWCYIQLYKRLFTSVQQSASLGCHFCSILCEAIGPWGHRTPLYFTNSANADLSVYVQMDLYGRLLIDLSGDDRDVSPGYGRGILRVEPISRNHCGCPEGPRTVREVSTGSPTAFAQISNWLSKCLKTHPKCAGSSRSDIQPGTGKTVMPSHLLEISPSNDGLFLRLICTSSLPSCPVWVTLSHCWGQGKKFCTTTTNIQEHMERIPLDQLPKTFREAVEITAKLGQRYLWIDSLCIQQDSASHWKQECVIMGYIYQSSIFTISALGARDSSVGCFVTRNPIGLLPLHVDVRNCDCLESRARGRSDTIQLCIRGDLLKPDRLHLVTKASFQDYDDEISNQFAHQTYMKEPLLTRGWVLQERILSPRTIYFGTRTISYECLSGEAIPESSFEYFGSDTPAIPPLELGYDEYPDQPPPGTRVNPVATTFKALFQINLLKMSADDLGGSLKLGQGGQHDNERLLLDWCLDYWKAVEEYSGLQLTFASDRLTAISGLIGLLSASTGFTNVAGLWKETFALDLLWRKKGFEPRPLHPKSKETFHAPSWSWASWNAPTEVQLMLESDSVHSWEYIRWTARVVDVAVTGDTRSGAISGGWAILTGTMMPVDYIVSRPGEPGICHIKPKGRSDTRSKRTPCIFHPDVWAFPTDEPTPSTWRSGTRTPPPDPWALLVMVTYGANICRGYGIVVQRTGEKTDDGREMWERVGAFYDQVMSREGDVVRYLEGTWLHESTERDKEIYLV